MILATTQFTTAQARTVSGKDRPIAIGSMTTLERAPAVNTFLTAVTILTTVTTMTVQIKPKTCATVTSTTAKLMLGVA